MPRGRKSIQQEGYEILRGMLRIGESKHIAKQKGALDGIYSYGTFKTYTKHTFHFLKWARREHKCKDVAEARAYVDEWLNVEGAGLSAYTIKLRASALAKLYSCSSKEFISTPPRRRQDIKRSRGPAVRDRHFSESVNADFVAFCCTTGLRRHEIAQVTAKSLVYIDGQPYLHVKGKGGLWRDAPIIGPHAAAVVARISAAGDGSVWPQIPSNADIHGYRREYAQTIYAMYARDAATLPRAERYDCRRDLVGVHYDRAAMLIASRALGHNRISVIAGHYLGE